LKGYEPAYKEFRDSAVIFPEGGGVGTTVEIPDLRIDGIVGSGANGIVFSGVDSLDRDLVIKVYPPRLDKPDRDIDEVHQQALSEAQKIASLKHPAIATVYKYGRLGQNESYGWLSDGGWPYCVMEMRPGKPLKEVLPQIRDNIEARRQILRQIFDALTYAEGRGSLHGDLHERNVLVYTPRLGSDLEQLEVSVIDFGTSIFAGRVNSEVRHAHLLRRLTFRLLPELQTAFVPTSRLAGRTGRHVLPRLIAALKLYDEINPSQECPPKLTPRSIGAELAYAIDFDLDVLWTALRPHLAESDISEVKMGLLEYLTHDHDLAATRPSDADLAVRLRRELEIQGVEATAILAT